MIRSSELAAIRLALAAGDWPLVADQLAKLEARLLVAEQDEATFTDWHDTVLEPDDEYADCCRTCGGSGGGPEHWRCPTCRGSGIDPAARERDNADDWDRHDDAREGGAA
jgi:hypothetical protein